MNKKEILLLEKDIEKLYQELFDLPNLEVSPTPEQYAQMRYNLEYKIMNLEERLTKELEFQRMFRPFYITFIAFTAVVAIIAAIAMLTIEY